MKKFNVHWLDGKIQTIEGDTIKEAFINAGICNGAMKTVDYYEEAKEVPMKYKEIILLEGDKRKECGMASSNTVFARQLMKQIQEGSIRCFMAVAAGEWICDVEITPLEILCKCIERKHLGKVVYSFDKTLFGLKCIKSFQPYFIGGIDDRICRANFVVKSDTYMRVHDKANNMWEVSYSNGSLFWTDLKILNECCITVSEKEVNEWRNGLNG